MSERYNEGRREESRVVAPTRTVQTVEMIDAEVATTDVIPTVVGAADGTMTARTVKSAGMETTWRRPS